MKIMKKTRQTILFWFFLLIGSCVFAQEVGKRDALLWEISGNGLTELFARYLSYSALYLYG